MGRQWISDDKGSKTVEEGFALFVDWINVSLNSFVNVVVICIVLISIPSRYLKCKAAGAGSVMQDLVISMIMFPLNCYNFLYRPP